MNDYCYDEQFSCLAHQLQSVNDNLEKILEVLEVFVRTDDEDEEEKDKPHDCRVGYLQMHSDEEGRLFINVLRHLNCFDLPLFKEQIDFCPVCGWESPNGICRKMAVFPRERPRF